MIAKNELNCIQFHEFPHTTVTDRQVIEDLKGFGDDYLAVTPVLQVRDSVAQSEVSDLL